VKIQLEDLLRIPYLSGGTDRAKGLDCLSASRAALERIFPDLSPVEFPATSEEQAIAIVHANDSGCSNVGQWARVGDNVSAATKLGDVIYGRRIDGEAFVAVLVDPVGRVAFSAFPGSGTIRIAARKLAGVTAVYRRAT
jgi:hypothetical protein